MSPEEVQTKVGDLLVLDLQGLRATGNGRYGAPPKMRSADLLRRRLACMRRAFALLAEAKDTHLDLATVPAEESRTYGRPPQALRPSAAIGG